MSDWSSVTPDDWSSVTPDPPAGKTGWDTVKPDNDNADFGDALSHTHQAINAVKRFTGLGDQPPPDVDVPTVTSVMKAFGHEAKDAWGPEKLGISDASAKILSDQGWFRKEGRDSYNPFGAFNELLFGTIVGAGDILLRSGAALLRGSQGAVFEATGSRDLAALPEAFFGTPHPLGIPKGFPAVKVREPTPGMKITVRAGGLTSEGVVPLEPSFTAEVSGIEAYHGSPHEFEAFDISKIGTGEGAQSYGHGLYFAQEPGVAESYKSAGVNKRAGSAAEVMAASGKSAEELRQLAEFQKALGETGEVYDRAAHLIETGAVKPPNIYKVRINADPATFLDWDKPLSEQGDIGKRMMSMLEERGLAGDRTGAEAYRALEQSLGVRQVGQDRISGVASKASQTLNDAGIPGIKYLDQGSRKPVMQATNEIPMWEAQLRVAEDELVKSHERGDSARLVREFEAEVQRVKDGLERTKSHLDEGTSNFVVFDDKLVQITHKNGVEVPDVVQALELGVIGPERPEPTFKDSPSELADAAVPQNLSSASTPEGMGGRKLGHEPGEYDQRGKEWIDKIDAPEDVRDAIENIAQDHDFFPEARGGVASPAARAAVAEAAGIAPDKIDAAYFATHFDSDGKVRAVIQALRQTAKDFVDASDRAVKEPSVETAAAAVEAEMRHTHVLEYTMGLRAESGRTLNAWKELLRETEHTKARVAIKKGELTGDVPVGTAAVVDAAKEVQDNLNNPSKKKLGLLNLIDQAKKLVGKEDEASVGRAEPLSPEISGLVGEARNVLKRFGTDDKVELDRLIDAAEKQAVNMVKQGAVKNPIEALPPELQALVDKTQRVVGRFGGIAKGEKAALLLARTGRTVAEQEQLARSVAGLTPDQVAKVLEKLRTSPEAKQPGWVYWLWQQGLISGLITHTKYLAVNTATVFLERFVAPELAALMGKARGQNVSLMAPLYSNVALVHSLPDAFTAAAEAFRTGNRVPLASEMRLFERGEESPQTKGASAAYMQSQSPDWGIWKKVFNEDQLDSAARVLGIPGRSANMIHTFYKVLSERASASTRAYTAAFEEGAKGDKFDQRYKYHLDNPSDDALRGAVTDAYTGAFMGKLGEKTEAWAHALKTNPIAKWMFPFQHIPWNIERMTIEYSPFAVLGPEMRSSILGEKGAPAQNLAIAKMVVGSSIIGYFAHQAMSGNATSHYPIDPKERKKWELLRLQPNSIKMGGYWVSLERLGPVGNVANIGAAIGEIIHHYDGQDDNALTSAIWAASVAAANQVGNEVGFQTLRNVFDALGSEKKGARFVEWQAGSFIPMSSFLSQNASIIDPYQRKADDLVAALKYRVPFLRETLPPKRDPLYGTLIPNPGYHAITRQGDINIDPIKMEMDRLKLYPGAPEDRISGVKLPPAMYDRYQAIAGPMVHQALEMAINMPGWYELPAFVRQEVLRGAIHEGRQAAQSMMQIANPQIINQAVQDKIGRIEGQKPTKLKE